VIRDGFSWYFAAFNRNKRWLTLNLRHQQAREILAKLIGRSDVLIENFRPGVLGRIGFDEARLKAINPELVCSHITGFGDSGPDRDRPSFDFIARTGNDHAIVSPYGMFRTADREVAIAPSSEAVYFCLLDAIGAPELRDHPDFRSNDDRVRNRAAMNAAIEARLEHAGTACWIKKLNAAGVPCDRIMTLPEALADPQTREQDMVIEVAHPGHGEVQMIGFPLKFVEAPCRIRHPPPEFGADTDAVLQELGYSTEAIERLRQEEVV
jgi:crotonobetainyl-CoA:carnitine CoA-transferase CaiB-like acyl-CoA transferase